METLGTAGEVTISMPSTCWYLWLSSLSWIIDLNIHRRPGVSLRIVTDVSKSTCPKRDSLSCSPPPVNKTTGEPGYMHTHWNAAAMYMREQLLHAPDNTNEFYKHYNMEENFHKLQKTAYLSTHLKTPAAMYTYVMKYTFVKNTQENSKYKFQNCEEGREWTEWSRDPKVSVMF